MTHIVGRQLWKAALVVFLLFAASCERWSSEPDLYVGQCVARVLPDGAGAVYLEVVNRGVGADRLESVVTPWARTASLRETVIEGHMARMRPADDGFPIRPLSTLTLEAGGRHVMLQGVAIASGVTWAPLCLRFARAGDVCVEARVQSSSL